LSLALLLCLALAAHAAEGTGTVQGTVRRGESPLAGARVVLGSSADSTFQQVATTDAQGSFQVPAVPLGVVSLQVFAGGRFVVRGEGILERDGEVITVLLAAD
jgi:hypothetical protein